MAKRTYKKQYRQAKSAAKQIKKASAWAIVMAIILLIVAVGGYYVYNNYFKKEEYVPPVGDISFHFMTLGNKNNGDSIYIKAGENDILIDAGSNGTSVPYISDYIDDYVTDGKLEYVIVTHGDTDHIAGFAVSDNIFGRYECETIIDFPLTNKAEKDTVKKYYEKRDAEVSAGAKHYTALECYNNENGAKRVYELSESVSMEILYNYYYDHTSSDENNYSVCIMFYHGSRKFLFTGDLEEKGEEYLAQNYEFSQVELFKAGHHGSKTSSNEILLKEIQPKICVVSCCAGYNEYRANEENIFPTYAFLSRISKYTDKVYVTRVVDESNEKGYIDLNGNIVVSSDETEVTVTCSASQSVLKDTEWCKQNRGDVTWAA